MKAIIIEDDKMAALALEKVLKDNTTVEVVNVFNNPIEARQFSQNNEVDLVFLDMEMPQMTGIEFMQSLKDIPQIIVVSSNKDYAAESFNFDVVDYIVKPVSIPRVLKAIEKAQIITNSFSVEDDKVVFVKDGAKIIKINLDELFFIEAYADYVQVNTINKKLTILSTMKAIQAKLPNKYFARVHRSYIVRIDKIEEIQENLIKIGDKLIPISRSMKQEFIEKLNLM